MDKDSSREFRPRRAIKKALHFNIIVVGASGLGKTTFINTLCRQQVIPPRSYDDPATLLLPAPLQFTPYTVELDEDGVKTVLTVVDTPGFGDCLDNSAHFDAILQYIERQYDDVLGEESKIRRNPKTQDARLHALLYFIAPTGHSLAELDIELMRRLGRRVNIIPLVAKSDALTKRELADFKHRVMRDIKANDIKIFDFHFDDDDDENDDDNNNSNNNNNNNNSNNDADTNNSSSSSSSNDQDNSSNTNDNESHNNQNKRRVGDEDDELAAQENMELREMLPFAIVGGTDVIKRRAASNFNASGNSARGSAGLMGRVYPWGTVEADDMQHSDNTRLRYMLLTSHIHELRDMTQNVLYEMYRSEKLSKLEGLAEKLAVLHIDPTSNASLSSNNTSNVTG